MFSSLALVLLCCVTAVDSSHGYHKDYQNALRKFQTQDEGSFLPNAATTTRQSRRQHYKSFVEMARLVDEINQDDSLSFEGEINEFSIETDDEQVAHFGLNLTTVSDEDDVMFELQELEDGVISRETRAVTEDLPESVDWRWTLEAPTNQGQCGCCWAFSTIATLESAYYRTTGKRRAFSVQELVDCTFEKYSWANGCGGGSVQAGLVQVLRTRRLGAAVDAPYVKQDMDCKYEDVENSFSDVRIRRIYYIAKTDASLLAATATGVVSVGIHAGKSLLTYKTGIYYDPATCTDKALPNHAVNVVGYGVTEGGAKYWLLRNSWGSDWGEDGYFRMSRDYRNTCNINEVVVGVQLLCQRGVECNPPKDQ